MGLFGGLLGKQEAPESGIAPWDKMRDDIRTSWGGMKDFYRSGEWEDALGYGNQSMVPGMNPMMRQGFRGMRDTANRGLGLRQGLRTMLQTARGDFLHGGPGYNEALGASMRTTLPMISSQFGGAGRTGSAYHANTLGQAASDAFAGQYGQERQRQMAAAGAIPGMAQAQFIPHQQMMQAGAQKYGMYDAPRARQRVMRDQQNRRAPLDAIQQFHGNAMQTGGMGGFSEGGGGGGAFGPLLGAGLTAAGMYFGGPVGGAIGAGIGSQFSGGNTAQSGGWNPFMTGGQQFRGY